MAERKLDVEGASSAQSNDGPKATYKVIGEEISVSHEKDGADVKLLDKGDIQDAKVVTKVEMSDDKYVVSDHRNGDAKLELDAGKVSFSGLTKDELMKYANDPFWVRLRWAMFALFWISWLAMLAGAIAIIVQAPKCPAPEQRKWFEIGPIVEVDTLGDLDKLFSALKEREVQGVLVPQYITEMDTYKVLDEKYVLKNQFTAFAAKAKKHGVRLVMELRANFVNKSNDWFVKSEEKEQEFMDYFIWAPPKNPGDRTTPPNNWVSKLDTPAWTFSEKRGEFYLHQFSASTPDLNFTNPDVVEKFEEVMKFWRGHGVSGFRLLDGRQLFVDKQFKDEPLSENKDSVFGKYDFLEHKYTSDRPELVPLLDRLRELLKDVDGFISIADVGPSRKLTDEKGAAVVLPFDGRVNLAANASAIFNALDRIKGVITEWPFYQIDSEFGRENELILVSLLLPVSPIFTAEQLQIANGSDWKEKNAQFSGLLKLRHQPSIMHGNTTLHVLGEGNAKVFAYTRHKSGTSAHLVAWNPNAETSTFSAAEVPRMASVVTAEYISNNYKGDIQLTTQVESNNITLSAKSAIIFNFVPLVTE